MVNKDFQRDSVSRAFLPKRYALIAFVYLFVCVQNIPNKLQTYLFPENILG